MKYVVRSMSTTDFAPGRPVQPFHTYLRTPEKRAGAFWANIWDAMTFDTPQEAEAEIIRAGLKHWDLKRPDNTSQIVPLKADHVPDFWDIQKMNRDAGVRS